ncbi:MAG: hypothetical protein HYX72_06015 [Acidobacteria bacterium]|nr:hypothetical protein [Acidobacteriota bacterium]
MKEKILQEVSLEPNRKTQLSAPFDFEKNSPRLNLKILVPAHVSHQVKVEEVLLGNKHHCTKVYRVHNQSSCTAFLTLVEVED